MGGRGGFEENLVCIDFGKENDEKGEGADFGEDYFPRGNCETENSSLIISIFWIFFEIR